MFSFRLTRSSSILKNYQVSCTSRSYPPGMHLYHVMACMFAGHLKGNSPINVLNTNCFCSIFPIFCIYSIHIVTFCCFCVWNCCHSPNVATEPTKFVTSLFCLFKYQITRILIRNNFYFSGRCSIDALFSSDTTGSSLFTCSSPSRSTENFFCEKKEA
jgi:hypothetical protein